MRAYITLLRYKMSCDDELLKKIIQSKLQFLPWGAWRDELSFIDELIGFEFETFKSVQKCFTSTRHTLGRDKLCCVYERVGWKLRGVVHPAQYDWNGVQSGKSNLQIWCNSLVWQIWSTTNKSEKSEASMGSWNICGIRDIVIVATLSMNSKMVI